MTGSEPTARQRQTEQFVAALEQLDAAGRARLKRNAGRLLGEARQVHQVFYQALPYEVREPQHEDYFLIATLFPLAPHREGAGSLGETLRRVRLDRSETTRTTRIDRRFQTLLDSDRAQLPFRLRQAVRLVAAADLPLDWTSLLRDVLIWELTGRPVQLRWARDYFVGQRKQPDTVS
jgi:CRISPR system Cascade subunit CasB